MKYVTKMICAILLAIVLAIVIQICFWTKIYSVEDYYPTMHLLDIFKAEPNATTTSGPFDKLLSWTTISQYTTWFFQVILFLFVFYLTEASFVILAFAIIFPVVEFVISKWKDYRVRTCLHSMISYHMISNDDDEFDV